jgi:hypothetical protein
MLFKKSEPLLYQNCMHYLYIHFINLFLMTKFDFIYIEIEEIDYRNIEKY